MADTSESLIEEIRVELAGITNNYWTADRWVVGQLKKQEHADLPRIEWEDDDGSIEDGRLIGDIDGNIATDAARFHVAIWHESKELCRAGLHNLIIAARNTAFGPNVRFGAYQWDEPAIKKRGRKLTVAVTLLLPVSVEPLPSATLMETNHQVLANGKVVC